MASKTTNHSNAVQVVLRIRPLIAEEKENDDTTDGAAVISYQLSKDGTAVRLQEPEAKPTKKNDNTTTGTDPSTTTKVIPPPLRRRQDKNNAKTFGGLAHILEPSADNRQVYETTLQPVVERLFNDEKTNQKTNAPSLSSACIFTYGHTGAGKTHTLLGYGNELGMYKHAAQQVFERLEELNQQKDDEGSNNTDNDNTDNNNNYCILVTATELYRDKVVDLLTGDECAVRQNAQGLAQVRGPMVTHAESGKIDQKPLGHVCHSAEDLIATVERATANRRTGVSTHHGQSSRSHLILELELVTPALVTARQNAILQEAELTRLKWLQTERMYGKHAGRPFPKWCDPYNDAQQPSLLRNAIKDAEQAALKAQKALILVETNANTPLLQKSLVFCDLAGNEYGQDSAGSTQQALEEAADINQSLLALKNVITGLRQGQRTAKHRDSKLTMILHRHMQQQNNNNKATKGSSTAIMMAHISSSTASWRKTINTLNYTKMGGPATASRARKPVPRKVAAPKEQPSTTTTVAGDNAENNQANHNNDAIVVQA